MEYCCYVWAGVPSCFLKMLVKLQKRIFRTVASRVASLEPLTHRQNVASLSLYNRYSFGRSSYELIQLIPLPYSRYNFFPPNGGILPLFTWKILGFISY